MVLTLWLTVSYLLEMGENRNLIALGQSLPQAGEFTYLGVLFMNYVRIGLDG